jgi:hypothetical protein
VQLYDGSGTGSLLGAAYIITGNDIANGFADVQTGTLVDGTTYSITARVSDQIGNQSDASGSFVVTEDANAVCYLRGTHIMTPTGEQKIEDLRIGDVVTAVEGANFVERPVRWIGRRCVDLNKHRRPETIAPVCVRRGAFGDMVPHRDLYLSPDHAIHVDGKLICARQLINGATIHWVVGRTEVDYFHVELDAHAIILAEGLPAESYLDTGNGGFFANSEAPLTLHPDLTERSNHPAREVGSCAPFIVDENIVRPVWQRLADRAATLGWALSNPESVAEPALQIIADGHVLRSRRSVDGRFTVVVPRNINAVRVVSRAGAPTDTRPWQGDRRRLGVYVQRIVLRDPNQSREIPIDHPSLSRGWWAVERHGLALGRWTDGDATLPLPACNIATILEVQISIGDMRYVSESGTEHGILSDAA